MELEPVLLVSELGDIRQRSGASAVYLCLHVCVWTWVAQPWFDAQGRIAWQAHTTWKAFTIAAGHKQHRYTSDHLFQPCESPRIEELLQLSNQCQTRESIWKASA